MSAETAKSNNSNTLKIEVSDIGKGITTEFQEHIFEPYYQAPGIENKLGTGLGLALTKQWILAMGGEIHVKSIHNEGTSFTIYLPIRNKATKQHHYEMQRSYSSNKLVTIQPVESHISNRRKDVPLLLIVEDNRDVIDYVSDCLQPDYQISIAMNGQEGFDKAREEVQDIIISDVMMPVKDGYAFCEDIKSHSLTNHIPVILLTAKATQEEKLTGLKRGADVYLTKPFDEKELKLKLENLLKLREAMQKKFTVLPHNSKGYLKVAQESEQGRFLEKIHRYLTIHLTEDFTINDLAREMTMSRIQLYRKLRAITGKSINQYIREVRLQEAHGLLKSRELTVAETAYRVGFNHPNYFSRAFKELYGMSPSQLKHQLEK